MIENQGFIRPLTNLLRSCILLDMTNHTALLATISTRKLRDAIEDTKSDSRFNNRVCLKPASGSEFMVSLQEAEAELRTR